MKMLLLFTALTLSGAAYAQDSQPAGADVPPVSAPETPVPPDNSAPTAPDPAASAPAAPEAAPAPEATPAPTPEPSAKTYPPCSRTVTDSCMNSPQRHSRRHVTTHHRVMKKK